MSTPNGEYQNRHPLPRYKYESIRNDPTRKEKENNKNLRLLQLKPATEESAEINCSLIVVGVDDSTSYEAVSWCWGNEPHDQRITISTVDHNGKEKISAFYVPNTLAKALRVLRRHAKSRTLWIDLICINQADDLERNEQVPMMAQIYPSAKRVCIWLDDIDVLEEEMPSSNRKYGKKNQHESDSSSATDESSDEEEKLRDLDIRKTAKANSQKKAMEEDLRAINFIRNEVLRLWHFDELCKNKKWGDEWVALLSLMRKPWFSRRWVVQEIALAKDATLYTAGRSIPWRDFVDAVSLFVEVEDASRRLTEIMQQHEVYNYVPDFFEDLSEIGASMLIKATSNLFRSSEDGKRDSSKSLEYLMSTLAVFDVRDPRDAVYALLAISKDSTPLAANQQWGLNLFQRIVEKGLDKSFAKKPFRVDYSRKIIDVFQDFVSFSIKRSMESDPERALDILCRPWAPPPIEKPHGMDESFQAVEEKLPSWIRSADQAAFRNFIHPQLGRRMSRSNADPLVGFPDESRSYRAAESRVVNKDVFRFKKCSNFYALFVEGFHLDTVGKVETFSQNGQIPWDWITSAGWRDPLKDSPPEEFWRTLVADRNQHGRNAPPFFERACHESVKRERFGQTIDTKKLITEGRCSIVAAFLRRVQAVIWNRCLAKCVHLKRLCMTPLATKSGDMICILYGCSVPVVLRRHFKSDADLEDEIRCDEMERNKPREDAARRIAALFRRKKAEQENTTAELGQRLPSLSQQQQEAENRTKKAARWERHNKEVKEIMKSEKRELDLKIQQAIATPKDDVKRQYLEFVGACYVHGMMNGEAIAAQNRSFEELNRSSPLRSQVFELH